MNDQEFQIACGILDDNRRLIAAGKLQRWDAVKWAVTVNLALAATSVALRQHQETNQRGGIFLLLALLVVVIAMILVAVINRRLTKTRRDGIEVDDNLEKSGINFATIKKREDPQKIRLLLLRLAGAIDFVLHTPSFYRTRLNFVGLVELYDLVEFVFCLTPLPPASNRARRRLHFR
jgi:hypothetical protein